MKNLNKFYIEAKKEWECDSIDEVKEIMIEEWGSDKGYGIFVENHCTPRGVTLECIEKIDEYGIYESDDEAAMQAEKDGFCKLIHDTDWITPDMGIWPIKDTILDTEDNRKVLANIKASRKEVA